MRVKDREEILKVLEEIRPDDFECIKILLGGGKKKVIGCLSKRPLDDICSCLFDVSLHRRITSVSITDGGDKYHSHLVLGTSECTDHTTNIDADVIEAVCRVYERRIDAGSPMTRQCIAAMKRREEEDESTTPEKNDNGLLDLDFDLFGLDIGMP